MIMKACGIMITALEIDESLNLFFTYHIILLKLSPTNKNNIHKINEINET